MAIKELNEFNASYKKLKVSIAKYNSKETQAHLKNFEASYKKCQSLEQNLIATLIPARKNGVTGNTLKDFKKDKNFYAVYKLLDKEVDELDKAQKDAKEWTNYARYTVDEIERLQKYTTKQLKLLKIKPSPADQKELDKLVKDLSIAQKDLEISGNLMGKLIDSRMKVYVEKFNKTIEKILDLAPNVEVELEQSGKANGEKTVALPRPLQQDILDLTFKKAEILNKKIVKHCDVALTKAKISPDQAQPEMKAAKSALLVLDRLCAAQGSLQRKHAKVIGSLNDKQKSEMKKSFERYSNILDHSKKQLTKTERIIMTKD